MAINNVHYPSLTKSNQKPTGLKLKKKIGRVVSGAVCIASFKTIFKTQPKMLVGMYPAARIKESTLLVNSLI